MIYWGNMLYLLNIQLFHQLLILAHILPTLDPFTPHHRTLVPVYQMDLVSTIPGMVHHYQVRYPLLMPSPPWISTIAAGTTIPLHFLQTVAALVLINHQSHLWLRGQPGQIQIYWDQAHLCTPSLLVTGKPCFSNFFLTMMAFGIGYSCMHIVRLGIFETNIKIGSGNVWKHPFNVFYNKDLFENLKFSIFLWIS